MLYTEESLKRSLRDHLRSKGFSAEMVEPHECPSPDLIISDGKHVYVIEIKQKEYSSKSTEIALGVKVDSIRRINRLSGIVKKSVTQIGNLKKDDTINILWVVGESPNERVLYEQLKSTLYGIRIVQARLEQIPIVKPGFFVTYGDFYKFRSTLDGVALGFFGGFFLNPLSSRYNLTKESDFVSLFTKAVYDPKSLAENNEIFICDGDFDRANQELAKKYLEDKYGLSEIQFLNLLNFGIDL